MSDMKNQLVIQIQRISTPQSILAVEYMLDCIASVTASASWLVEAEPEQSWLNIYISSATPARSWRAIKGLIATKLQLLQSLSRRWVVIYEGSESWDNYVTLENAFLRE